MKKGLLIILSGPSGVGKGTIRRKVMEDNDLNLAYSISVTTRAPRPSEKNGIDYFFVSDKEFDDDLAKGNFLEHAEFVGNRYGTPKDFVEKLRNEGKNVFLEIEVSGATQIMENYVGNDLVTIFLIPPSYDELRARICGRHSECEEVISARLAKAKREMKMKYRYQYIVLNDDIARSSEEIKSIIRNKINAVII
ncbi:MAG TPA: guanylate kinase [Bacilli bacterium]|nr:guanylate kinase [Bacilli bacterium]